MWALSMSFFSLRANFHNKICLNKKRVLKAASAVRKDNNIIIRLSCLKLCARFSTQGKLSGHRKCISWQRTCSFTLWNMENKIKKVYLFLLFQDQPQWHAVNTSVITALLWNETKESFVWLEESWQSKPITNWAVDASCRLWPCGLTEIYIIGLFSATLNGFMWAIMVTWP